jgi:putative transposase
VTPLSPFDKAFDGAPSEATAEVFAYEPHVRRIGEEKPDRAGRRRHPARRWVVERTIAWLNRCRAILVRWAKKDENYLALNKLACAYSGTGDFTSYSTIEMVS